MEKRKIICIIGPTASGKTGWGVEIARKFGGLPALPSASPKLLHRCRRAKLMQAGEIVSADSRQVYRGLDIGTGKEGSSKSKIQMSNKAQNPNVKKLTGNIRWIDNVPQWLIDIVEPETKFTMFDWLGRARKVIEDIFARGKIPVVVGGTGLYVQSLVEGFELTQKSKLKSQNCNSKIKTFSRKELEKKSLKQLQRICLRLKTYDLRLDLSNPHRLIRAIERAQDGEVIAKKKPNFEVLQIAIDLPREILYQRIDQRVEEWFKERFVEEVQGLLDRGVDSKWLEKIGLEYRILGNFVIENSLKIKNCKIENLPEFQEMKQRLKFAIHAYARRQLTWFRRFPEVKWCKDLKSAGKEIRKFLL